MFGRFQWWPLCCFLLKLPPTSTTLLPIFSLYEIFFAMSGPVPCHWWWQQPFLGARALVCSSALIAFQQAGQRLAPHSTTLGAFQEPCAGIPLCRDLQSEGGTSKASVRLGVDDYNPPGYRFTRLLNFKSSCGSILACTFAFLAHKSCHVKPWRMLDFLFVFALRGWSMTGWSVHVVVMRLSYFPWCGTSDWLV